jgi:hypothetical protein
MFDEYDAGQDQDAVRHDASRDHEPSIRAAIQQAFHHGLASIVGGADLLRSSGGENRLYR